MLELTLDVTSEGKPVNRIWTFGGNTCHAPLWLRSDLQRHLDIVRDELGFQNVRCHGMLSDNMGVVREDGSFDFTRINAALDMLVGKGMAPWFELSAMPKSFARDDQHICEYGFYSSPPRDWCRWYDLNKALMQNLKSRYGAAEVRKWHFEVWNEPNIPFWTGTQAEYFHLYDLSARAIKEVDAEFRVGGPSTARVQWIGDFLAHISKPSPDFGLDMPRCDFISTHIYPSDVEFWEGGVNDIKVLESNIVRELFLAARRQVDAALGKDFPLICGEWNSAPYQYNRDDCNNAAFVVKAMSDLSDLVQGSLYWDISDIYEEAGWHYVPFHAGCGVLTVNDIPKSSFNAFKLLKNQTGRTVDAKWSQEAPGLGFMAAKDGRELRLLVYHYREAGAAASPDKSFALRGLPSSASVASITRVLPGKGSAFEKWVELGRPDFPNRDILNALEAASRPAIESDHRLADPIVMPCGTIAEIAVSL